MGVYRMFDPRCSVVGFVRASCADEAIRKARAAWEPGREVTGVQRLTESEEAALGLTGDLQRSE